MIPEEAYKAEIKLDQNSVFGLCNSLNAWLPPLRVAGFDHAAFYMLRAQGTIIRLFEENQKLKKMIETIMSEEGRNDT